MMSRRLGQYISTQSVRSVLGSNSISTGLTTGNKVAFVPKDNHHSHHVEVKPLSSAITSVSTSLVAEQPSGTFAIRQYSKVPASPTTTTVLASLCDTEINDFKSIIPENEENSSFVEDNGFVASKDNEYAYLKKTAADGSEIVIRFDLIESMNEENMEGLDQNEDEEGLQEQQEEGEEEQEEGEEGQEEGEDQETGEEPEGESQPHEHPYEVCITRKIDGKDVSITFGCFASADGSYTVSGFYYGGFNEPNNPVDIGGTSSEFQDNILLFLQQFGVTEGLSFYIHDFVHNKKLNDYVGSFQTLKKFIESK